MQERRSKARLTAATLLLLAAMLRGPAGPGPAMAQPPPDSLKITVSPGLVNFALKPSGISQGSFPITVTTSWQIQRGGTEVRVYAYFAPPSVALANPLGGAIPSARVFGRVNSGAFQPFTGTSPLGPGGSLLIFGQQVRNNKQLTRSDSLDLQIDTTGLNLSPGAYSGSLRVQALAL